MKRMFILFSLLFPLSLSAQDWQWQNPLPQGNSLDAVHVFDENTVIAVGVGGTVLRTTDGGTTWTSQAERPAGDLASVFFTDSDGGWAVGGGGNILHTTDGGGAWTAQASGTTYDLSSVFFADENAGWAVGGRYSPSVSTIRHTTSGGTTWMAQAAGTPDWLYSIFFTDVNTGWAVGENGTILHTANGGTNWTTQIDGMSHCLYSVFFADSNTGWAVGYSGSIRHTTNGGTNWTAQTSGTTDELHSVVFTDANTGWAVGSSGSILHTTNGGTIWTAQTSGTVNRLESVRFTDPDTGWAVGDFGTILHTTNGGESWTPQSSGPTDWLYAGSFTDAGTGWSVGDLGTILHTANGGGAWTPQTSGVRRSLRSVIFADDRNGWAVGDLGSILHTTNGGGTWLAQISGTADLSSVFFTDAGSGWAVGDLGTILHTADGGASWTAQTSGATHDLTSVVFTDASTGWGVGDAGDILHTANGGATWAVQTSGTTSDLSSVVFTDANTGWAVGDLGTILHTTDGGSTWAVQTSGTTGYLSSISFADPNNGFAVGDPGTILHTTDGGATWTAQISGTTNMLEYVRLADANTGWTFGAGGTILHTATGGTGIDPPAAPTLASPEDGATVSADPLLSWNDATGASWYSLQVSATPSFLTSVLNQTNIMSPSYQLSGLEENATYYWRASLTDSTGTSGWSETWSFTVGSAPNQVALVAPVDGAVVISDSVEFVWHQSSPLVDRYWFEYSTDSTFAAATTDSSLVDTATAVHNLQHHETYYWRVRAHNAIGWGLPGDVWSVLVLTSAPAAPLLVSPPDGATGQPLAMTLTWRTVSAALLREMTGGAVQERHDPQAGTLFGSTDTVWYHLQLALESGFDNLLVNDSTLVDTTGGVSSLEENTVYYWRVRARNAVGAGPWSDAWSFATLTRPAQVVLAMPEDGAIIGEPSTVCEWLPSAPGVDRYWFEWAGDSTFAGSTIDSSVTDTTSIASPLQNNLTYYWKVRAHNDVGWGEFSEVWSFAVVVTHVEETEQIPTVYSLNQNYPNPFNPSTTIRYGLPQQTHVVLEVFNMLGQRVAALRDEVQAAGYHEVIFERADLASGLYFYRLSTTDFVQTRKLVLLR